MVARLDETKLFASNCFDGRVGARSLDVLLQLDVPGAQAKHLGSECLCLLIQTIVVEGLLAGCDQRVQQQWDNQHGREAQR